MNKKLAIKGHSTRGEEIIKLLEMMGGINDRGYIGTNTWKDEYYTLDNGYIRAYDWCDSIKFTLEGFWEKYPYKIGDKAIYVDDNDIVVISEIKWDDTVGDIFYNVKSIDGNDCFLCPPELLKPYKEVVNMKDNKLFGTVSNPVETKSYTVSLKDGKVIDNSINVSQFMQLGKTVAVCFNTENYEDEVELQLGDYEIVVRDGKTYAVKKKPKYPKTYEECCEVLGIETDLWFVYEDIDANHINPACISNYRMRRLDLYHNLEKLLICRDAYWKIYGEEMGLGKPWKPNEDSMIAQYGIRPLLFPSKEIYNMFYDNFKDLIEQCKELL